MSDDRPSPTLSATTPELRSPSPLVGTAGCIAAAILVLVFAILVYWQIGGAPGDLQTPHSPLVTVALDAIWTLGAAALLLTRVGVLAARLPKWLLRVGPWVLAGFFALLALRHLLAVAADGGSGHWPIDLQGPLLLLLAGLCIIAASEESSSQTARRS